MNEKRKKTAPIEGRMVIQPQLTEKQHLVLLRLVRGGHFEEPSEISYSQVAEELNVKKPTIGNHARAARRKIFEEYASLFPDDEVEPFVEAGDDPGDPSVLDELAEEAGEIVEEQEQVSEER